MRWEPGIAPVNFVYTLAAGFALSSKLSCFLELFGTLPEDDPSIHRFDGGLVFLLLPNLQLDLSAGADFKNTSENHFIGAGVSWRFSVCKKSD
jgi:hypothetical protein